LKPAFFIFLYSLHARTTFCLPINPAAIYVVFRAFDKRQIKAQPAAKAQGIRYAHGAGPGYSIGKSCNAELVLIRSPYLFEYI